MMTTAMRRKVLDRADREALKELMSIAVLTYSTQEEVKHTRVEALSKLLKERFSYNPHIQAQVDRVLARNAEKKATP